MIFKLKPILLEKVWGGKRLGKMYNNKMPYIGECWGISGHKSHSNKIINGAHQG